MKILGIVLAILFCSAAVFTGVTASNKARDAAKLVSMVEGLAEGMGASKNAKASKAMDEIPSSGRLNAGAGLGFLAALATLGLVIVMFAKKNLVLPFAAVAVGAALLAGIVYPSIPTGPTDGAAPRPQELVAAGLAVVGALGAWLAARKPADTSVRAAVAA